MGKIRIKSIGGEEKPAITEAQRSPQRAQKIKKAQKKRIVHLPGMKGGERVVAVGPTEEELAITEVTEKSTEIPKLKKKKQVKPKKIRSKKYLAKAGLVDRNKTYSIEDALALLAKLQGKIDETVELHINTLAPLSLQTNLPHGTGKKTRVAIATDALINEIEKGKIDFDVLLATPLMMAKLAAVAKILGPRGLMPNPKAGTISEKPEALAKKYEAGQVHFKTEAKFPILHLSVGKISFGKTKLGENIQAAIGAVKKENIKKAVLKSTMSPGIKIDTNLS